MLPWNCDELEPSSPTPAEDVRIVGSSGSLDHLLMTCSALYAANSVFLPLRRLYRIMDKEFVFRSSKASNTVGGDGGDLGSQKNRGSQNIALLV